MTLQGPAGWILLAALSAVLGAAFWACGLPAALLLGPMGAAIILAIGGMRASLPRAAFLVAQGVIGCLVARALTPALFGTVAKDWPLFLLGVASALLASQILGTAMSRRRLLPGTTAIWGTSPGAASAMVLLAEEWGGDPRLVAVMQYLRVVIVATTASVVARLAGAASTHGGGSSQASWLGGHPADLALTVLLAAGGGLLGRALRLPAGPLLLPAILGALVQDAGWARIVLPEPLLVLAYTAIGWSIGLRFTRAILSHALRVLPVVLLSIALLMGVCGLVAWLLVRMAHLDPLTAYLATSPGGLDSVAIITAGTQVDVPFVMAMQTTRLLLVILLGPVLARLSARWAGHEKARTPA